MPQAALPVENPYGADDTRRQSYAAERHIDERQTLETAVSLRGPPRNRRRRSRTLFTDETLERLEDVFCSDPYPDIDKRESLAQDLGVTEARIQVWFQNRRSRERRSQNIDDHIHDDGVFLPALNPLLGDASSHISRQPVYLSQVSISPSVASEVDLLQPFNCSGNGKLKQSYINLATAELYNGFSHYQSTLSSLYAMHALSSHYPFLTNPTTAPPHQHVQHA